MQISNQSIKRNQEMKVKLRTCILPNLSKIVERCMYDQLQDYFHRVLLKYQCWFKKWFSTQHCLLTMIEILRKSLDSTGLQFLFWLTYLKRLIVCRMTYLLQSYMLTVSRKGLWICWSPTLKMENKEFVWITLTVNGETFDLVCLKDLYLVLCYLIYFMQSLFVPPWHFCGKLCGQQHPILYWFKNSRCSNQITECSRNTVTMAER